MMNARGKLLVDLALSKARSDDEKDNIGERAGGTDQHNLQDRPSTSSNNDTSIDCGEDENTIEVENVKSMSRVRKAKYELRELTPTKKSKSDIYQELSESSSSSDLFEGSSDDYVPDDSSSASSTAYQDETDFGNEIGATIEVPAQGNVAEENGDFGIPAEGNNIVGNDQGENIEEHVGCDGVVGSDQRYDSCGVCGGNNSSCRVVSGLFTRPQLPVGYNLITQIPQTACNLSITELKQSRNYLALRKTDGTFILNGNWAINWSGEFEALGTKFSYHREDDNTAESISSPGPLAEPLDLMVIYQQPNPGIKYQYQLPVTPSPQQSAPGVYRAKDLSSLLRQADSPSLPEERAQRDRAADPRHNVKAFPQGNNVFGSDLQGYSGDEAPKPKQKGKKRKFSWKITGFTECSKSCGGGAQTAIVVCIRDKTQLRVPEKRCASLEKPSPQVMRCNLKPCVAEWVGGEWGECSVTCGDGMQTREILCRQEITPTLTMTVAEGACLTPPSPLLQRTRACQRPPCPGPGGPPGQWSVGAWSQCSAKCGQGVQTRSVLCPSGDCNINERPTTETPCNMPPCQSQGHRHLHTWLYTEWPQECSESCGTGVQKRRVVCSAGPKMEGFCDVSLRPDQQRSCSSDKHCGALWFSGPWGQCTASCGRGRQSRSVVCLARAHDQLTVVADDKCLPGDKPAMEQLCKLQPCGPEWYIGDWSQCSRSCDTGAQRRDVRCLDVNQQVTTGCGETSKPPTRRSCNTHKCPASVQDEKEAKSTVRSAQSNDSLRDQPQPPETTDDGSECRDKFRNCHLVVQARLCKYKYYRTSCCLACHNKL